MAYTVTTATDRLALFNAIATFATANGWTVNWNLTTNNGQMGLSKGTTFVALGARITTPEITRQMLYTTGTVLDVPIIGTLCTAFVATQTWAGGHTNAPGGTSVTSSSHVWTNDWKGPFTNVFLFSNASGDHIHVVAQTGSRFSYLSFGLLDNAGMSTPRSSYLTGSWWEFWENNASPLSGSFRANHPVANGSWGNASTTSASENTGHFMPFSMGRNIGNVTDKNGQIRTPSGVVNAALFPAATPVLVGSNHNVDIYETRPAQNAGSSFNRLLGGLSMMNAMPTSIGLPLFDLPVFWPQSSTVPKQFFGLYPDVRTIWMENMAAGEEIDVNGDIYKAFPVKQKGTQAAIGTEAPCNSWGYGLAFKKVA